MCPENHRYLDSMNLMCGLRDCLGLDLDCLRHACQKRKDLRNGGGLNDADACGGGLSGGRQMDMCVRLSSGMEFVEKTGEVGEVGGRD